MKATKFAAYVGIDWADRKHDVCLREKTSGKEERLVLQHSAEAIDKWAVSLQKRFAGKTVGVCLEQSKGPLIYALQKYDFLALHPINPSTLAKYREAFSPSKAKDDPTDAELLEELLRVHPDRLTMLRTETRETRILQFLVEDRRGLMNDKKRLGNRLTSLLKKYYPLVLELFPKMGRTVLCKFILRWTTLEQLQAASDEEIVNFFRSHNSAQRKLLEKRLELIHKAVPLTTDEVIISTAVLQAKTLCEQIIKHNYALEEYDREIECVYLKHPDAKIFSSLPGAGSTYGPRLLAALGTDRNRFSSAHDVQCFLGIAPVLERSGKQEWIHWRYCCSRFLRQSFHEWAGETIRRSFWAKTYYHLQRSKGKSHSIAVRALAYKWIRIVYKLWNTKTLYDESRYLDALQRSGSPLLAYINKSDGSTQTDLIELSETEAGNAGEQPAKG